MAESVRRGTASPPLPLAGEGMLDVDLHCSLSKDEADSPSAGLVSAVQAIRWQLRGGGAKEVRR
jgi:hypothetical protein